MDLTKYTLCFEAMKKNNLPKVKDIKFPFLFLNGLSKFPLPLFTAGFQKNVVIFPRYLSVSVGSKIPRMRFSLWGFQFWGFWEMMKIRANIPHILQTSDNSQNVTNFQKSPECTEYFYVFCKFFPANKNTIRFFFSSL